MGAVNAFARWALLIYLTATLATLSGILFYATGSPIHAINMVLAGLGFVTGVIGGR